MSTPEIIEVELLDNPDTRGIVADYDIVPSPEASEFIEPPILLEAVRRERHRRDLMALPHEEIVEKARDGDVAAFEMLVTATTEDTYNLAYRLTGSVEDAQDIVQEAYLRAYKAIGRFRADSQFSTWMYRIVVNCANTNLDKRRKHRHSDIEVVSQTHLADTDLDHDPAVAVEAKTLREKVMAGLDTLPGTLRSVVVLRDIYDLPHAEIADSLGITETAAKVRLHRARKQLREVVFPSVNEQAEAE
jgi:RNA polymerase sigma-70 factor (ECF subfamily)